MDPPSASLFYIPHTITLCAPNHVLHSQVPRPQGFVHRIKTLAHGTPIHIVPVSGKADLTHLTLLQHIHQGRAVTVTDGDGLAAGHQDHSGADFGDFGEVDDV